MVSALRVFFVLLLITAPAWGASSWYGTFTSSETWTITGVTHGLGTDILVFTQSDGTTVWDRVPEASLTINQSSGDVIITWLAATAGRVFIIAPALQVNFKGSAPGCRPVPNPFGIGLVCGTGGISEGTPASASASCVKGTMLWDATYVYTCVATNTWKRALMETW